MFTERDWHAEILVVNDGSTDCTAAIVQEFAQVHPEVRLLNNPQNRGKGFSVRHGVLHAVGEIVMFTDADLSAPMEEAERLFDALDRAPTSLSVPGGSNATGRPCSSRSTASFLADASMPSPAW